MAETLTKKHLSVTVYYLLVGVGLGWPALALTGITLPDWCQGITTSPVSLAVIHILVLGSMMTVAFGVMYQIIPIAFQAPPVSRHVLLWHLPIHILAAGIMVSGFFRMDFLLVGVGGTILLLAACAYFYFLLQSYRKARNQTHVHRLLLVPMLSLFAVILVGIFQALLPSRISTPLLLSHVLIGGLSFWAGLVIVISYKLVPMFILSHGYKASLPRTASLYFSGILLWIVTVWLPKVAWTPAYLAVTILVLYGLISFTVDIVSITRSRKRKRIVVPVYEALIATGCLVASQIWLLVALWLRPWVHSPALLIPPLYLFAFGGILPLMFAYMQKIVPFLWFEYRFSKRPERKTAPLIDDMVPKRLAKVGFAVYYIGVLAGLVRSLFALGATNLFGQETNTCIDWASAVCLTLGSLLMFLALQHVTTIGGRRPADQPETPTTQSESSKQSH